MEVPPDMLTRLFDAGPLYLYLFAQLFVLWRIVVKCSVRDCTEQDV